MKLIASGISLLFFLLAGLHLFSESITVDAITIALLGIASFPWMFPYLKTLELPGGVKIELKEVRDAVEKVSEGTNLVPSERDDYSYLRTIASHDPNLALVAIRIEIEKSVREALGEDPKSLSLSRGIRQLASQGTISNSVANGLRDFIELGNHAAHGVAVESEAAEYAIENAEKILGPFKKQLANAA